MPCIGQVFDNEQMATPAWFLAHAVGWSSDLGINFRLMLSDMHRGRAPSANGRRT
ncbi:hypothetical protein [Aphanothece microscopica]|uniref:hypothetical protein n=1 Tax=Aphanothece microscopica TaxID=1049561 RepID=UPI003CE4BFB3